MQDYEKVLDRSDVNEILERDTEEKAEELKEIIYDAFVSVLVDVLKAL